MVPRAVQDAGYTAVGLGVLALQQVQTRGRGMVKRVQITVAPVTSTLNRVPRLPGPIGAVIEEGKVRLVRVLSPAG